MHPSTQRKRFRSLSGPELLGPRTITAPVCLLDWRDPSQPVTPSPSGPGQMPGTRALQALGWWQGHLRQQSADWEVGPQEIKCFVKP